MPFHRHGLITCEHGTGKIPQLLSPVWQLIFLFFDVPTGPQFLSSEKNEKIKSGRFLTNCFYLLWHRESIEQLKIS